MCKEEHSSLRVIDIYNTLRWKYIWCSKDVCLHCKSFPNPWKNLIGNSWRVWAYLTNLKVISKLTIL